MRCSPTRARASAAAPTVCCPEPSHCVFAGRLTSGCRERGTAFPLPSKLPRSQAARLWYYENQIATQRHRLAEPQRGPAAFQMARRLVLKPEEF